MAINIGVLDEQKISLEGIKTILAANADFNLVYCSNTLDNVITILSKELIHILIINIHSEFKNSYRELIQQILSKNPKIAVLILSSTNNKNFIFQSIKIGARGFLMNDSSLQELIQAIYSLRGGHDYFSSSITHLIIKDYLDEMHISTKNKMAQSIDILTPRELEILKLWSNGFSNQQIAEKLFISIRTVETHKNNIMHKLDFKTIVDVVKFAIRNNLAEL